MQSIPPELKQLIDVALVRIELGIGLLSDSYIGDDIKRTMSEESTYGTLVACLGNLIGYATHTQDIDMIQEDLTEGEGLWQLRLFVRAFVEVLLERDLTSVIGISLDSERLLNVLRLLP